ncbi:tripartite motif-containing protein 16-like protein isoform X2 [Lampris incognitus]|uniref:tripartite motif-containing protein 16-like protein isoform X2 n=1 Tax=Lampris incognitus TaxID=2546036 RepID=UPI0024B4FAFB|nr:tripartite motif-containing protein 16-like protein isoform X2 [Lampris incognitus]
MQSGVDYKDGVAQRAIVSHPGCEYGANPRGKDHSDPTANAAHSASDMETPRARGQEDEEGGSPPPTEKQDTSNADDAPKDADATGTSGDSEDQLPDDVLCDSCIDDPSKALKSCLTCLVSYCQVHLRPHLEKAKFQNHRLVEPLHDIECHSCEVHRLPLELFCMTDRLCVCRDCGSQEHEGHATASLGEARKQIQCVVWYLAHMLKFSCMQAELQKKQEGITHGISAAGTAIDKLQSNVSLVKQFARLQKTVEEARGGAAELLEAEQKQALRQAEGIQAHLEQRQAEMKKTLSRIDKLSRNKADVDFLQEYSRWTKGEVDLSLPAVYIRLSDQLASFSRVVTETTQELCSQVLSCYQEKLSELCKSGMNSMVQVQTPESQLSSLSDPETRKECLKYARSLTFDPDTTHHFLRLTEDNRKLTNTSPWQHSYPDNPWRFQYWRQAVTSESLYLGRHYIEAELSGEGAHVGVTYKSIDRKGEQSSSCITGNDFSWCLGRNMRGLSVWHADVETPLEAADITRVGLYIDFYRGSIAFYDVTGPMTLLHKFKADFMEPLYATALLSKKDGMVSLANANHPSFKDGSL